MIQTILRAEGLPLDLAYVPLIESAFQPRAVSAGEGQGVWQFIRSTATANGLKHDWYIDERSDPEKATVAAAKYLKSLYELFGDSVSTRGDTVVVGAYEESGDPPGWGTGGN
jgi:membrane-bound lytic murein transglycosylase D